MRLLRLLLVTCCGLPVFKTSQVIQGSMTAVTMATIHVVLRLISMSTLSLSLSFHCLICFESIRAKGRNLLRTNSIMYAFLENNSFVLLTLLGVGQTVPSSESVFYALR